MERVVLHRKGIFGGSDRTANSNHLVVYKEGTHCCCGIKDTKDKEPKCGNDGTQSYEKTNDDIDFKAINLSQATTMKPSKVAEDDENTRTDQ